MISVKTDYCNCFMPPVPRLAGIYSRMAKMHLLGGVVVM